MRLPFVPHAVEAGRGSPEVREFRITHSRIELPVRFEHDRMQR
jgi:hypothetical protein